MFLVALLIGHSIIWTGASEAIHPATAAILPPRWEPLLQDRREPTLKETDLVIAQAARMSPMEWGYDRPGLDYSSFQQPVDNPANCQSACQRDPRCRAWTYVRPYTIQGPYPRCWLKHAIPQQRQNPCCVSGFKQ
jgi:hypothetical protein